MLENIAQAVESAHLLVNVTDVDGTSDLVPQAFLSSLSLAGAFDGTFPRLYICSTCLLIIWTLTSLNWKTLQCGHDAHITITLSTGCKKRQESYCVNAAMTSD